MLSDKDLEELAGDKQRKPYCITVWATGNLEMDAVEDLNARINAHMNDGYVIAAGSLLHYTSSPYQGSLIHNFIVLMVVSDRY